MQKIIENAWENLTNLEVTNDLKDAVTNTINQLDQGILRVAEKVDDKWKINLWVKKAVLLSFRLNNNSVQKGYPASFYDKVMLKSGDWGQEQFNNAGFRSVPGSVVRKGAFIAKNVVLMPSFVNIGAYVDEGSMIDTWATVGSCAQIGKNCHISGGTGIGGVLEPLQASPVIIEDDCFIGARSEVAEGVIVEQGAVISMGVFIGASTKIVDRKSGEIYYGRVPAYAVVVPGSMPSSGGVNLDCAVIVKTVDAKTRSKTGINELLRD
ncbi:MAG: 2,3,4,5-tetrahydropyridine-2,6-dicarboxylate N-succinyltransferase [Alphaproteobacteria bacterium]